MLQLLSYRKTRGELSDFDRPIHVHTYTRYLKPPLRNKVQAKKLRFRIAAIKRKFKVMFTGDRAALASWIGVVVNNI